MSLCWFSWATFRQGMLCFRQESRQVALEKDKMLRVSWTSASTCEFVPCVGIWDSIHNSHQPFLPLNFFFHICFSVSWGVWQWMSVYVLYGFQLVGFQYINLMVIKHDPGSSLAYAVPS